MNSGVQFIKRPGKPALQVLVLRVNGRRRASIARGLFAAGRPGWFIRHKTGLSEKGLARAITGRPDGLWGAQLRALLREVE